MKIMNCKIIIEINDMSDIIKMKIIKQANNKTAILTLHMTATSGVLNSALWLVL